MIRTLTIGGWTTNSMAACCGMGSGSPVVAVRRSSMACSDDLEDAGESGGWIRWSVMRDVPGGWELEALSLEHDPVTDVRSGFRIRFGELEHARPIAGEPVGNREGRIVGLNDVRRP